MSWVSRKPPHSKDKQLYCGICTSLIPIPDAIEGHSQVDTAIAFQNAHLGAHAVLWAYEVLDSPLGELS